MSGGGGGAETPVHQVGCLLAAGTYLDPPYRPARELRLCLRSMGGLLAVTGRRRRPSAAASYSTGEFWASLLGFCDSGAQRRKNLGLLNGF